MAYRCECGNDREFLEVFQLAVDRVDANSRLIDSAERDVGFYLCPECDRQISYRDFVAAVDPLTRHIGNSDDHR